VENATYARAYLNKMSEALQSLNYHGKLVYIHDGDVESLQLVHKRDEQGEYERLVHLSGTAREVIRNNDVVTCYLPDSQSVLVGKRRFDNHLFAKLTTDFDKFVEHYHFTIDGEGRVAGQHATIVLIKPKDSFRYGYRLWIAKDNSLLLKSDLLNTEGKILEQLVFVELNVVEEIPTAMLEPAVSGESYTWHNDKEDSQHKENLVTDSRWQIGKMPTGFFVTGRTTQTMKDANHPVDHMVVSDGLASISIYIKSLTRDAKRFAVYPGWAR
jgi:sigma-E factor negative regulatory protein RseB